MPSEVLLGSLRNHSQSALIYGALMSLACLFKVFKLYILDKSTYAIWRDLSLIHYAVVWSWGFQKLI